MEDRREGDLRAPLHVDLFLLYSVHLCETAHIIEDEEDLSQEPLCGHLWMVLPEQQAQSLDHVALSTLYLLRGLHLTTI